MATYPPNQTTPGKGSGNYLWNWLGTPLKKFAEALQPYVGGDKLVAGSKELTLNSSGNLTLNSGDLRIISPDLDVILTAQNNIALEAQNQINITTKNQIGIGCITQEFDSGNAGGPVSIGGGGGAGGNTINAGNGGNVSINGGNAGTSSSGNQATGGNVFMQGGYTSLSAPNRGGDIYIRGGSSQDNIEGFVRIGSNTKWIFDANTGAVQCPVVSLATLGSATPFGKRAMINDSTVAASGNFGAIAVGGGSNIVPVFSNGTNWLIG